MVVDDDASDIDESYDKIKAIIDRKHQQNKKLKEARTHQAEQLRLVNDQLEHSRAKAKKLEEEREALFRTESELRHQLSAARAANTALQRTIAESKEQQQRQLQANADLTKQMVQQGEQAETIQSLQEQIDNHQQRYTSLEAHVETCRIREAETEKKLTDQREACEELRDQIKKAETRIDLLGAENRSFFQGIVRREQELEELKKVNAVVDRKNRAIRGLQEGQDEAMEANKQLRKDVANLGAELAVDRGLTEVDGARMHQALARGSLTAELVDRLTQNAFFEDCLLEKITERAVLVARASSHSQPSRPELTGPRPKRRRTAPALSEPPLT
jgi:chromosome segregation ATPase